MKYIKSLLLDVMEIDLSNRNLSMLPYVMIAKQSLHNVTKLIKVQSFTIFILFI